ncbi:MAG: hypothetical protein AAGE13_03435 [Pseudomonadota bacterium]
MRHFWPRLVLLLRPRVALLAGLVLAACAPLPETSRPATSVAVILPDASADIGQYALCPADDAGSYQVFHEAGLGCRGGFVFAGFGPAAEIAQRLVPLPQGGVLALYALKPPGLLASDTLVPGRYLLAARTQGENFPTLFRPEVAAHQLAPGRIQLLGRATDDGLIWPQNPPTADVLAALLAVDPSALSAQAPQSATVTCREGRSPRCTLD